MRTLTSWDAVVSAPAPCDHLVQLYTSERALATTIVRFVARGLAAGDGVVAITTAAHWADVASRLADEGVDAPAAQARGQLVVLDAAEALARLLVDGMPERDAMRQVVMPAITSVRSAGYERIRAFGEMVDLLNRRGDLGAAVRLEELWNELIDAERVALLCAYAVDPFDRAAYQATLPSIGQVHSHLMPVEDPARLERAIDLAFVDVFGMYGDTRLLRELFVRHLPHSAAMPLAQGALLALRRLDARLADSVLERAARHYHGA